MMTAQANEQTHATPLKTTNWAKFRLETKDACSKKWTDEETYLYECVALTSWENR